MHPNDVLPSELFAVAAVFLVAAAVPVLFPWLFVPGVVLEIAGGALLGPQMLDWIQLGHVMHVLSDFGMAVLFLMAGFEVEPDVLRGRPMALGLAGWGMSFVLAGAAMWALAGMGVIRAPGLTALAISTTAIGALLPVLRDSGALRAPYGPLVLAAGAVGEAAPVVGVSLVIAARQGRSLEQALVIAAFAGAAALLVMFAGKLSTGKFATVVARTVGSSGQLPVRLMLVLTILLVVAAESLDIEAVLGAFLAGALARASMPEYLHKVVEARLQGLGYGFFVPIFFIKAGASLDLHALFSRPAALLLVPLLAALMLAARGAPALLLYRRDLTPPQCRALALHTGTQLPMVVAIAALGVDNGMIQGWQGAALVGAAVLTLLVYPAMAARVLRKPIPASAVAAIG